MCETLKGGWKGGGRGSSSEARDSAEQLESEKRATPRAAVNATVDAAPLTTIPESVVMTVAVVRRGLAASRGMPALMLVMFFSNRNFSILSCLGVKGEDGDDDGEESCA